MKTIVVESLEQRRLFAGVTLLATGRLGGTNGWMATMTSAITAQYGGPSQVPEFILSVNQIPNTGNLAATISQVAGTGTPQGSSSGEIIVLVDYYNISANASFGSTYIGSTIANFLLATPVDGINLASMPIHEIGVSRGAAILDGVSLALGQAGVWVDQETYLDPNPLAAQQDPPSAIYDNVAFVDNYWRNDGSVAQTNDGHPVNGAYNLNVAWLDSEAVGYVTPHLAPAGYYIGTIDPNATQSGEGPIYSQWYGTTPTMPARNATGWISSAEVGAPRPLSGVWTASGGTGARTAAGQVGSQWGNASDLTITSGNTISTGNAINVSYIHQDRDSADTITFYLDSDRNPYNNTFAATLGSVNLAQTNVAASASASLSTAGVTPGSYWLCAKITDAAGHTRYTYEAVTAPLTVTNNPVATLIAPATVLASTKNQAETILVSYAGAAPVDTTSLGNSNLQVSGPGFTGLATFVGVDGNTGSKTRVATYSVPAPAGGWSTSSNGTYTISLQANQVRDTSSRYVPGGVIGNFAVTVVNGSLAGTQATAAPSYNLTALGTTDWAHWGTGNNAGAFDDKAGGGGQISKVTQLGAGSYGSYYDSSRSVNWSDGSRLTSDSGDTSYLWANNALGAGYSFTVPAGTSAQTLYVYAGGYSSGATLTAHLSDGSAADFVATASGNGLYTKLFTITFNASSAGQTLTVSLTKTTNINGSGGSVDLIAAALVSAAVAVDSTPPKAALTSAPSITATSTAAYNFVVSYSDNVAVNAATLGNNNLLVTGSGYSHTATLVSSGLTNGATIVATYSVPAPAGGWTAASNGAYTIALQANQVGDTSGNLAAAVASLGTFTVSVPAIGGGSLAASQSVAAGSYNLTALGASDWAHWGTGNNASAFDHKATGGSQISNVTKLGAGSYGSWYDPSRTVSWSDGVSNSSNGGDNSYLWANNALGAGYSFTVAASTTLHTLYIYAGGNSSGATLTAHLSDGSAADVTLTASGAGLYTNMYAITFKAASAGQTLTISYVKSTNINGTSGSIDLIAAALV